MHENEQEQEIRQVFYRLNAMYGAQFSNLVIGNAQMASVMKAEWKFWLADIPLDRIKIGLRRLGDRPSRSRKFTPGVFEFVDLCLPSADELDIPEKWDAFEQAKARDYRHPMIACLVKRLRYDRLTGERPEQARREWDTEYDAELDAAKRGHVHEWPAGMEPQPPRRKIEVAPATDETVARNIDAIRRGEHSAERSNGA